MTDAVFRSIEARKDILERFILLMHNKSKQIKYNQLIFFYLVKEILESHQYINVI